MEKVDKSKSKKNKSGSLANNVQEEVVHISEDMSLHKKNCNFYLWNTTHRMSLLTDKAVEDHLFTVHSRKRGRKQKKGRNTEVEDQKIREEAQKSLSKPIVQKYLKGSRAVYESFRENLMKKCCCEEARMVVMRASDDNADNVEDVGMVGGSGESEEENQGDSSASAASIPAAKAGAGASAASHSSPIQREDSTSHVLKPTEAGAHDDEDKKKQLELRDELEELGLDLSSDSD